VSAVEDRLDLSTADKSEADVVREYLRLQKSDEGTLAVPEYVGMGTGILDVFTLDHNPVLTGTLSLYVAGVLQIEGAAEDYTIVLATGVITFNAGSIPILNAPVTGTYHYGADPIGADDTTLTSLLLSAKQAADRYLNNPFEEDLPRITLVGVVVGQTLVIDGQVYTAAAATDVTEREFAVGLTDTLTADELCICINSPVMDGDGGAYGVAGVTATNVAGVITLTKRSGRVKMIEAGSSYDSLLVEYVRTEGAIPEPIATWVLQRVSRGYERRVEGLATEGVSGFGTVNWGAENFDLLDHYRFGPGV